MGSEDKLLQEYIENHTSPQSNTLKTISRLANIRLTRPRMLSGKVQGQLLKMLCQISKAKYVLEIGTFAAYATIAMAEGLPNDGEIHTIEIDDEMQDFINNSLSLSKHSHKIHLHIGSAYDIIPNLMEKYQFDIVYIDANKREYIDYYNMVIDSIPNGGIILADNTLWDGKVLENKPKTKDIQTLKIKEFNDIIQADQRVENIILPLRDGLSIIRKK